MSSNGFSTRLASRARPSDCPRTGTPSRRMVPKRSNRWRAGSRNPCSAAFAIRSLERIATLVSPGESRRDPGPPVRRSDGTRGASSLATWTLRCVGSASIQTDRCAVSVRPPPKARPVESPGVEGRRYWAMRTSPWERPYIWAEAQAGRLRQGWGWAAEQNLEVIADDRPSTRRIERGAADGLAVAPDALDRARWDASW